MEPFISAAFPWSEKAAVTFSLVSNFTEAKRRTSRPLTNQTDVGRSMESHQNFGNVLSIVEPVDGAVLQLVRPTF